MDISMSSPSLPCKIPTSDAIILEGHTSEVWMCSSHHACFSVLLLCFLFYSAANQCFGYTLSCLQVFTCSWSPAGSLLASGWVFVLSVKIDAVDESNFCLS